MKILGRILHRTNMQLRCLKGNSISFFSRRFRRLTQIDNHDVLNLIDKKLFEIAFKNLRKSAQSASNSSFFILIKNNISSLICVNLRASAAKPSFFISIKNRISSLNLRPSAQSATTFSRKSFLISSLFFISISSAFSQDDEVEPIKEDKPKTEIEVIPKFKPSVRGYFKLPNGLANNAFKKVFNGVSNLEVSYIQPFAKNFFVGVGMQHGYWDVNRYSFIELSNGKMQTFLGVGEAGFQKYLNSKWYYMLSAKVGYGLVGIRTDNCTTAGEGVPQKSILFNEGLAGIYLHGNDRMSYGFVMSYQMYHFAFDPTWVCRTSFSGLTDADYQKNSQTLTIGFSFTCILGKMLDE